MLVQQTAKISFSINVIGLMTMPAFTPPGDVLVNQPFLFQLPSPIDGKLPYIWSATGLPTGLSIDQTGLISGTPTILGSFTIEVTVKDSEA